MDQINGRPTIIKRIYLEYTYTFYSLFIITVNMSNLGPGHNNEVVGHKNRYA